MSVRDVIMAAWGAASNDVDPYWPNVALYLPMDGSNGGTTFTDVSSAPKAFTATGATTSTSSPKFGTANAVFAGSQYIDTPHVAQFVIGTQDATIEYWIKTIATSTQYVFGQCTSGGADQNVAASINTSAGKITARAVNNVGSVFLATSTTTINTGTWFHIAQVIVGGKLKLFVNGAQEGGTIDITNATVGTGTSKFAIGRMGEYASGSFVGEIDDFRYTPGIARYTNNFSVPTKAFPTTGNAPYATWNPSDKGANVTLANGNLTESSSGVYTADGVRATVGKSTGKWYWEQTVNTASAMTLGVGKASALYYPGADANGYGYYYGNGNKITNNAGSAYGETYTDGDVIGVMWDADNGTISFLKNNAFQGIAFTGVSGTLYPMTGTQSVVACQSTANFGQNPLKYTPPNGTFWNPKGAGTNLTFSNNNLSMAKTTASAWSSVRANTGKSTGKWYWEVTVGNDTGSGNVHGAGTASATLSNLVGGDTNGRGYYSGGQFYSGGTGSGSGASYTTGDIIGIALDLTTGTIGFYKNGVLQGTPYSGLSGTWYPMSTGYTSGNTSSVNFGATPFAYSPPSGYSAWDSTVYNAGVF